MRRSHGVVLRQKPGIRYYVSVLMNSVGGYGPGTGRKVATKNSSTHMPTGPGRKRHAVRARKPNYCFSKTDVPETFSPLASVPCVTSVRVLPSSENVIVPLVVTLPSFLLFSS
ncbi:MAG: hypothetical protein JWM08_1721 [Candidatus Angelobacter sp.]|nr:hypothetical protein [Candidatus Angelobacter sp.]